MRLLRSLLHASLSAVLLLLPCCRQVVGIEERKVVTDGGTEACGLTTQSASCAQCIALECCDAAEECAADPICRAEESCVRSCEPGDSACQLACSERWEPAGVRVKLADCRRDSCAAKCGSWDCVGRVHWQAAVPVPDTITISAHVDCSTCNSVASTGPSEGVKVSACSISDPRCHSPLAVRLSDHDGNVELVLATRGKPLSVFLEFHKENWVDTLLILGTPPLSFSLDVGVVLMEQPVHIEQLAADVDTHYDPELAVVKVRANDCNLEHHAGVALDWGDAGAATISSLPAGNSWDAVAVNFPIPANLTTRLTARLATPEAPVVAVAYLVARANTVTLAPFVTPTP